MTRLLELGEFRAAVPLLGAVVDLLEDARVAHLREVERDGSAVRHFRSSGVLASNTAPLHHYV